MPTPAIRETPNEYADASPRFARGCGCFCFGWDNGGSSSHSYLLQDRGGMHHEEKWLVAKLKQLSELVAGPRWKNFIRKIGRLCHGQKQTQFQYSPESYALNFVEDGHLSHSFSSRFAPQKPAAAL